MSIYVTLPIGGEICYTFEEPTELHELRVFFDPDFSRESVSVDKKMRVFAQKCNVGKDFEPMKVAKTFVRAFEVYVDGKKVYEIVENYHSLIRLSLVGEGKRITVRFLETWGEDSVHVFSCDVK